MSIVPSRSLPGLCSTTFALCWSVSVTLAAQEVNWPDAAIEDNSFLIEEAYNQEAGVVQHISNFQVAGPESRDLFYALTQEWPVRSQRHQFSYTIPLVRPDHESLGFGDVLLNYRFQVGAGHRRWAFAPRLSAVLPTGRVAADRGYGALGWQVNLPLSYRLSSGVVTHFNAGATVLPHSNASEPGAADAEENLTLFNLGASVIAPVQSPVQLMLETVVNFEEGITSASGTSRNTWWVFSPGLRAAINLGHLQIVPGVAVPISTAGGKSDTNLFFYLSFEHPFRRTDAD